MRITDEFVGYRAAIDAMIIEADSIPESSPFKVDVQWRDSMKWLDFVRDLSDDQLKLLRLHTGFITGKSWYTFVHSPMHDFSDVQKEKLNPVADYLKLIKGLPRQLHGEEPRNSPLLEKLGIMWNNRLITTDLLDYQRTVANLHSSGLLDFAKKQVIVEIGGGYGGLAHQMIRAMNGEGCYIIIDTPQLLYWQAVFLRINNPDIAIYLYGRDSLQARGIDDIIANSRVVLLPFFVIEDLVDMPEIDIAINMASLADMPKSSIRAYCKFLANKLRGRFYVESRYRYHGKNDLRADLLNILAEYFDILRDPNFGEPPDTLDPAYTLYPFDYGKELGERCFIDTFFPNYCSGPNTSLPLKLKFKSIKKVIHDEYDLSKIYYAT